MESVKEKICRLCLNAEDDEYTPLEASAIGKVKAIIPELELTFPNDTLICSKCRVILEKAFELKRTFSKNNEIVQSDKEKSGSEKIDLSKIVVGHGKNVCRICLQRNEGEYISINVKGDDDINKVLEFCIPELDLDVTTAPALCSPCHNTLCEMYNFKTSWLSAEGKIQSRQDCTSEDKIDLAKILIKEEENDFLSGFEVQDEEGTDIFDNIPTPSANTISGSSRNVPSSKKRFAPPASQDEPKPEVKKVKLMTDEITDEELPHMQFNVTSLYNPSLNGITVEDWLARVDEYKKKFDWSDYTTIHKVLVKLKGMQELYIWFSNIADIMDWGQWRQKLVRAFPRKNDYHIYVRKMMARKKKREETYVTYYTEKLQLMEPLNLTGEQKVSCIFGGIADVLVCCVGRVGDYKNPEDLLDYFKSCDDKQSVVAQAEEESGVPQKKNKFKIPVKQLVANPIASKFDKKKLKMRCYNCGRIGHSAIHCRDSEISDHMNRIEKVKMNSPGSNKELAMRPKKLKSTVKCQTCGKMGHATNICRYNKYPYAGAGTISYPPVKKPDWAKKVNIHPNAGPPPNKQNLSKGDNEKWSRCRECGKFGSKQNPCCSARTKVAPTGPYAGPHFPHGVNNRDICLRCYKMGHQTKDCAEFARRNFRN